MKKIIAFSLALVIMLFVYSNTFAENGFSTRNGITFGMSQEQIISIEKSNGLTDYGTTPLLGYYKKPLLGFKSVTLFYSFDKETGGMYRFSYNFLQDEQIAYDTLFESLSEKYGQPNASSDDNTITPFIDSFLTEEIADAKKAKTNRYLSIDLEWGNWILVYDDYGVSITLYYDVTTSISTHQSCSLVYELIPQDELYGYYEESERNHQDLLDGI